MLFQSPNFSSSLLSTFGSWAGWVVATILATVAILLLLLRTVLPGTDIFNDKFESWLSAEIGVKVDVDRVSLSLDGRFLSIKAHHLILSDLDTEKAKASFRDGIVEIDLISSISSGELITTSLTIDNPRLSFTHHKNGNLVVDIVNDVTVDTPQQDSVDTSHLVNWIFSQPSIKIRDAEILILSEQFNSLNWHFSKVDLELISSGYRHQATGEVSLKGESATPIEVDIEWFGDIMTPHGWDGMMHLKGHKVELTKLLPGRKENQLSMMLQGRSDIEWWGEWLSGRLERGYGSVARDQNYSKVSGLAGGEFLWRKNGDREWLLQIEKLKWGGDDEKLHPSSALVERKKSNLGEDLILGTVDRVHLVPTPAISGLYAAFKSGDSGVSVYGELEHIQFKSYPTETSLINNIEAEMNLNNISFIGRGSAQGSGVYGVNGSLAVNGSSGRFTPNQGDTLIKRSSLYEKPMRLKLYQGSVAWQQHTKGVLLAAESMAGEFGEVQFMGSALALVPKNGNSPVIDMEMKMAAKDVTEVVNNLPEMALSPALIAWLQRGVVKGELTNGMVKVQGQLDQFPYSAGGGKFTTSFTLQDTELNYANGWPPLSEAKLSLLFEGESLQLDVSEGNIDGLPIHKLSMSSKQLGRDALQLEGQIVTDSRKLLKSMQNTPLQEKFSKLDKAISMDGYALLDLGLTVPLQNDSPIVVEGMVEVHDNKVVLKGLDLALENINGNIEFNSDDISIEGIKGKVLGGDLHLTAFTSSEELGPSEVVSREFIINLNGELESKRLIEWLELTESGQLIMPLEIDGMDGKEISTMKWGGRVKIDLDEKAVELHLHSDLKGIGTTLPEPFKKWSYESVPTTLTLKLKNRELNKVSVSTPERIKLDLKKIKNKDGDMVWGGDLILGVVDDALFEKIPYRTEDDIVVRAKLDTLSIGEWLKLRATIMDRVESRELSSKSKSVNEGSAVSFNIKDMAIIVDEADIYGQPLTALSLQMKRKRDELVATLNSKELQGKVVIPFDPKEPLLIDLAEMNFIFNSDNDSDTSVEDSAESTNPADMPGVDLLIHKTVIDGVDFGELKLSAIKSGTGLLFENVNLKSAAMNLSAEGSWHQNSRSNFSIKATGDELGKLLQLFGYGGNIDKGAANIELQAKWQGSPADFSLATMDGDMNLSVTDGQLLDVDQGAGRIFGLLGIHTLARRLTLNFSDVTDKGLSFDSINGSFTISDGNAHTENLIVDGPTVHIKVVGRTGIVDRDYDQVVSVSPKISESLPATGALIGGPAGAAVGSVVLLYQKLFKKDGIITNRYKLSGSWDDPQLDDMIKVKAPVTDIE